MLDEIRHLAAGTERGVFLFRPRGRLKDWEMVGYGLYGRRVTCLTVYDDGSIAVGLERGMVKHSRDWLEWRPLYQGIEYPDVYSLCHDPKSRKLYCGTSPAAIFRSTDEGKSWESVGNTCGKQMTSSTPSN